MRFAIGAMVTLRCCPSAHPGIVRDFQRGRVIVRWADLNIMGRHRPEALMPFEEIKSLSEVSNEK